MREVHASNRSLRLSRRAARPDNSSPPLARSGWVHLCNGLDPVRDGGMVPSILGMTGALGRLRGGITIVTPTPSRLDDIAVPAGLTLKGPETDLEASVRTAEVVHLHGLWQAHTRRALAPPARHACRT